MSASERPQCIYCKCLWNGKLGQTGGLIGYDKSVPNHHFACCLAGLSGMYLQVDILFSLIVISIMQDVLWEVKLDASLICLGNSDESSITNVRDLTVKYYSIVPFKMLF